MDNEINEEIKNQFVEMIRFTGDEERSNDVIMIDLVHYVPQVGETLIAWEVVDGDRCAENYKREGNKLLHSPKPREEVPNGDQI